MRSIAKFRTTSLFIALLLAAGCIVIPDGKPLSDPYISPVDESLCGVWRLDTDKEDPAQYLVIEKSQAKGNPVLLKFVGTPYKTRSKENTYAAEFYCSTTTLGDVTYLNVLSDDLGTPDSYKEWIHRVELTGAIGAITAFTVLVKYRVKEGRLDIWWEGAIKPYAAILEAPQTPAEQRAALIKHLKSTGGRTLFPETDRVAYVRVK
jgi:hypothetical protein